MFSRIMLDALFPQVVRHGVLLCDQRRLLVLRMFLSSSRMLVWPRPLCDELLLMVGEFDLQLQVREVPFGGQAWLRTQLQGRVIESLECLR